MKGVWKRGLTIILTGIIACSMISCSKDKKVSKGQYVEKELTLPEELGLAQEASLTRGKDNTVYLIGADNNGLQVLFESKDNGQSWNKRVLELPKEENKVFRGSGVVSEEGKVFFRYNLLTKEDIEMEEKIGTSQDIDESEIKDFEIKLSMEEKYIVIDEYGNTKELNLDYLKDIAGENYYSFKFDREGDILVSSNNGEVVRIDANTGEEIKTYSISGDFIIDVTATENYLIVVTNSKILKYKLSDALKKLNAEIMSGNGPDIICLDGIDAEPYIEKGILEDISDVIKDYDKKNLILSNVVDAYTDKGKIYEFPIGIKLPVTVGENIGDIKDIDTLNKFFQQQFSENKRVLSIYNIETLFPSLCNIYSDEFIRENNIDKNNLKEFFKKVKEMKDIAIETTPTEEYQSYFEEDENYEAPGIWKDNYWNVTLYAISGAYPLESIGSDSGSIDIGGFGSFDSLSELVSCRAIKKDLDYIVLPSEDNSKFIPIGLIGVNAKSKEKDLAKDFIHLLLSEDVQKGDISENRFPVNTSVLEKCKKDNENIQEGATTSLQENNGKTITCKRVWPSDEECEKLIDKIKNAKKPVDIKPTILVVLKDAFDKYDSGEISLEEAVQYVIDNTDLDLAE